MRVDNRVAQVPPLRTRQPDNEATSRSPADNGCNRTRGELPANPTVLGHQPVDLLVMATAPTESAVIAMSFLIAILVAEAVAAGAPQRGWKESRWRRRSWRPRPRRQPRYRCLMRRLRCCCRIEEI
jgi:hypothetical protein